MLDRRIIVRRHDDGSAHNNELSFLSGHVKIRNVHFFVLAHENIPVSPQLFIRTLTTTLLFFFVSCD